MNLTQELAFAVCVLFGDTPCVFGPCWLVDSPSLAQAALAPRILLPVMSAHTQMISGSQQHPVFMQRGGTSAPRQ